MSSSLRTNWLIAVALIGWLMWLLAPVLTPFVAAGLLAYVVGWIIVPLEPLPIGRGAPDPRNPPSGCVFRDRCPKAFDRCASEVPRMSRVSTWDGG